MATPSGGFGRPFRFPPGSSYTEATTKQTGAPTMNAHYLGRAKPAMKRIAELLDDENAQYAPLLSFALGTAWAIIATLLVTSVFEVD
jgi:hypothetical protein